MKNLEYIIQKELTSNMLDMQLESTFKSCYSCIRVWSAWSYNTMSREDFVEFTTGDDAFEEMKNIFQKIINNYRIETIDDFYHVIEKQLSDYELFYNQDIELNFEPSSFDNDIFNYLYLNDLYLAIVNYQKFHLIPLIENELH